MAKMPQIIRIKYELTGFSKAKKQLSQLSKLFDRCVISGKKAGLSKKEISEIIKLKVK